MICPEQMCTCMKLVNKNFNQSKMKNLTRTGQSLIYEIMMKNLNMLFEQWTQIGQTQIKTHTRNFCNNWHFVHDNDL